MSRLYITFGGAQYDNTTQKIVLNAQRFGADTVHVYDDAWLLTTDFYRENKWMWDTPGMRGFGWFCWKPYVILHALQNFCKPGDVVLYTDADTHPIANLWAQYDRCVRDGGIMLFGAEGCSNRQWVKEDCWTVMAAREQYPGRHAVETDSQHAVARFMLFREGVWRAEQFLMEWLTYCLNPLATTFAPSKLAGSAEWREFQQHRTEQAILSLLAHKYGCHLYREADAFGNAALAQGKDDWYGQLFVQEGMRLDVTGTPGSRFRNV